MVVCPTLVHDGIGTGWTYRTGSGKFLEVRAALVELSWCPIITE